MRRVQRSDHEGEGCRTLAVKQELQLLIERYGIIGFC